MFCPNCGTQNAETAQACSKCGFQLKGAAAPKFKGTMLMMNQPGAPPPAQRPAPGPAFKAEAPPIGAGAPSGGAAPAPPNRLKGTIVGVAPPSAGGQAPDQQTFGGGQGVNPLGGTVALNADALPPFGAEAPPAQPQGGFGAAPDYGQPQGGYGQQGYGGGDPYAQASQAPQGGGAYGAPPAPQGAYGAPQGADPYAQQQQGYGAPADYGQQMGQAYNAPGQAYGQPGQPLDQGAYGQAMQPYQGGAPMAGPGGAQPLAPGEGKPWLMTLLLCIFAGGFGVHRFYVGKIGSGIAQLLTLGGCGIWTIVDLIMIITGKFTDAQNRPLVKT